MEDRDVVLYPSWPPLLQLKQIEPLHPEVEEIAQVSFSIKNPPEIKGSGYIVRNLEAASACCSSV